MRGGNLSARIGVGIALAVAGTIPAGHAKAPVVDRAATAFTSARALNALDQRWNAEAARFSPARARKALDARWIAEARSFQRLRR